MRSSKRKNARPRFGVEILEARTLLDGNVSVLVDRAGNLTIQGDESSNCVVIDQLGDPGTLTVTGCVIDESDQPTSINGDHNLSVTLEVSGATRIKLKGGNDLVATSEDSLSTAFPGRVDIETGEGDDFVDLFEAPVNGDVRIETSQGADRVFLTAVTVNGSVSIRTSQGTDQVEFRGILDEFGQIFGGVTVSGETRIETGHDSDEVEIGDSTLSAKLEIKTGKGDDFVGMGSEDRPTRRLSGHVRIDTSDGNDQVLLFAAELSGKLDIETGKGDDFVSVGAAEAAPLAEGMEPGAIGTDTSSMRVRRDIRIDTSDGNDTVVLFLVDLSGKLDIETGKGDDSVNVALTTVAADTRINTGDGSDFVGLLEAGFSGRVRSRSGNGDDTLCHLGSTFSDSVEAHGGMGMDLFVDDGSNLYTRPPRIRGFDVFDTVCPLGA